MNNIVLLLILSLLLTLQTSGWCQTTVPSPLIPESMFPLGAFDISTVNGVTLDPGDGGNPHFAYVNRALAFLTTLSTSGFNCIYHVNMPYGFHYHTSLTDFQTRQAVHMPEGMSSYIGMDASTLVNTYLGDFRSGMIGFEQPYYLLSTEQGHFDNQTAAIGNRGQGGTSGIDAERSSKPAFPQEWYIKDLNPNYEVFSITDGGQGVDKMRTASDGTNTAVVDFIFRLDGTELDALSTSGTIVDHPTDVLFSVTAAILDPSVIGTPVSTDITWSSYSALNNKPKESTSVNTFQGKSYKVVSLSLPLPTGTSKFAVYRFQLLTKGACGIFVRGFRLRSKMADEILTGAKDIELGNGPAGASGQGLNGINATIRGTKAAAHTAAIALGGELFPTDFRVLAYIDNLWYSRSQKHIYSFLSASSGGPSTYGIYRSVYQDQNGVPPSTIMEENFSTTTYYDSPHPFVAGDAIPSFFRDPPAPWTYDDMGFPLASGYAHSTNVLTPGYLDYLTDMQGNFTSSTVGGKYNNADDQYQVSSEAAYKYPLAGGFDPRGRWFALINTETTVNLQYAFAPLSPHALGNGNDTNSVDNSHMIHARQDVVSAIRKGASYFNQYLTQGGGVYSDYLHDGLSFHDLSFTAGPNSNFDSKVWKLETRGPNAAEIRSDVWHAIAYGAKGIYFNPFCSDGGGNVGVGDNGFGKYDPATNDPNTGHFTLYDGPTYNNPQKTSGPASNWANENQGPFILGGGDGACSIGPMYGTEQLPARSFLGTTPASKVTWDARVIKYVGTSNLGTVYPRQLIPLTFSANGSIIPTSIVSQYAATGAVPLIVASGSGYAWQTNGSLPDAGYWIPELETGRCTGDSLNWYVWYMNTSASPLLADLPSDENVVNNNPFRAADFKNLFNSNTDVTYTFGGYASAPLVPTFYGYHDKWIGASTAVHDLLPIASTLANIHWLKTVNLAMVDITDATGGIFDASYPIKEFVVAGENHTSQRVQRYAWSPSTGYSLRTNGDTYGGKDATIDGSAYDNPAFHSQSSRVDANDELLYELGLFDDPSEVKAQYFVVANRRSWPVRFDSSGTPKIRSGIKSTDGTHSLLGAIDVRQFNFKLNWAEIHTKAGSNGFYSVTNVRSGAENIVADNDASVFSVTLEPGEGTLFRIRPAIGFIAGRTSYAGMAYNNGHRIAELTGNQKIMTWENQGKIEVAFVNSPAQTGYTNFVTSSNVSDLYTPAVGKMEVNPSVTAKPNANGTADTIVIIWNETDANAGNSPRTVRFASCVSTVGSTRSATWTTTTFGADGTVAWDGVNGANNLVTPSITPALDGFLASWAVPSGASASYIQPALVGNWGTTKAFKLRKLAPVNAGSNMTSISMCVFPTLASRDESSIQSNFERLHLSWEEDYIDGTSQIYYKRYEHTLGSGSNDLFNESVPIERVSKNLLWCHHHHPNIAVTNPVSQRTGSLLYGEPLVTWESFAATDVCDANLGWISATSVTVMLRERYYTAHWSNITSFYPKEKNLPLPLIKTSRFNLVDDLSEPPATWPIRYDILVFQDTLTHEAQIRRLTKRFVAPDVWTASKLIDGAQFPNLTQPFLTPLPIFGLGSFTYRGSSELEDGSYYAKITANENPAAELKVDSRLVTALGVTEAQTCEIGLKWSAGRGSFGPPTAMEPWDPNADSTSRTEINWLYKDLSLDGFGLPYSAYDSTHSISGANSYGWQITEDSIRTNNFIYTAGQTLRLNMQKFIGDTLTLHQLMPDTSHFVSFTVLLKDSATGSTVMTVDQWTFRGGPLTQGLEQSDYLPFHCPPINYGTSAISIISAVLPTSGKGYLTVVAKRDTNTPLDLFQDQGFREDFNGTASDSSSFKKSNPGASAERSANLTLAVYPNPSASNTNVEIHAASGLSAKVEVFDVVGRLQATLFDDIAPSGGSIKLKFKPAGLPAGAYLVRATSGNDVVTKRFILRK